MIDGCLITYKTFIFIVAGLLVKVCVGKQSLKKHLTMILLAGIFHKVSIRNAFGLSYQSIALYHLAPLIGNLLLFA